MAKINFSGPTWQKILLWIVVVLVGGGSGLITSSVTSTGPIWLEGTELQIEVFLDDEPPPVDTIKAKDSPVFSAEPNRIYRAKIIKAE